MKILIFAEVYYPDVMGGGEYSTRQMAEGLVRKGHEVVVCCLGSSSRQEMINGVRVKRKYIRGLSEHFLSNAKNNTVTDPFSQFDKITRKWGDLYPDRKWYERYRRLIGKEKPDAVHTVSPMTYMGRMNLWRAAYDLKIPVSHVCRGPNLLELKFLGGRLDGYNIRRNARASRYLTALAAPSRFVLARHNRVGIRGRRYNEVICNAVDFEPVSISAAQIAQKENRILYAGEIREGKGIRTLVQAVEGLEEVSLLLIGRGEPAENVRNAKVLGWMEREALFEYMKKAKAVVLPSEWEEPFGRILIEAIYLGTIAIGSDRGGIPEVLNGNKDYIFHSGDAKGLRKRLERVLRMNTQEYMREVLLQRKTTVGSTDEVYVDQWEKFFLRQLNERYRT